MPDDSGYRGCGLRAASPSSPRSGTGSRWLAVAPTAAPRPAPRPAIPGAAGSTPGGVATLLSLGLHAAFLCWVFSAVAVGGQPRVQEDGGFAIDLVALSAQVPLEEPAVAPFADASPAPAPSATAQESETSVAAPEAVVMAVDDAPPPAAEDVPAPDAALAPAQAPAAAPAMEEVAEAVSPPAEPPPPEMPAMEPSPPAPAPPATLALPDEQRTADVRPPEPAPEKRRPPARRNPSPVPATGRGGSVRRPPVLAPAPAPASGGPLSSAPPVAVAAPVAESDSVRGDELRDFGARVWFRVSRHRPTGIKSRGTTVVTFSLSPEGALIAATVTRSSGIVTLDQASLAAVQAASPFPAPPAGLTRTQLTFAIPFEYR